MPMSNVNTIKQECWESRQGKLLFAYRVISDRIVMAYGIGLQMGAARINPAQG